MALAVGGQAYALYGEQGACVFVRPDEEQCGYDIVYAHTFTTAPQSYDHADTLDEAWLIVQEVQPYDWAAV